MTPPIVCLCGSTRFRDAYETATREYTLNGWIVLSVGYFGASDPPDSEIKARLDALHLAKIRLAQCIHVLNVGGYVGESTQREIAYAFAIGRDLSFLDPVAGDAYLHDNAHDIAKLTGAFVMGAVLGR